MSDFEATGYLSDYAYDEFVSQDLSKLTECNAPDIASNFSQSSYWIGNFVLNSIFGHQIGREGRRFCLAFLRRAEAAFFNYELARRALLEFADAQAKLGAFGPRKTSHYFRSLHFFENCLAMQWQGIRLFSRLSQEQPFQKGDGSDYEKLNTIYNVSRHYDPAMLAPNLLHAVWISNEGLNTEGCLLSFTELEGLLVEIGNLADMVASCEWDKSRDRTK